MNTNEIIKSLSQVFEKELIEIKYASERVDKNFAEVVAVLKKCTGKIVMVGVGKNMPIAQKMVATLNSTGTLAQFLHAGEALHGDLGLVTQEDVAVVLSKSGNTAEIKAVLPSLKKQAKTIVAICGDKDSTLGEMADYYIDASVSCEADPNNLAPTSSTTVQLVICDAIAVALLEMKDFTAEEFGRFHPGGSLGKNLTWTVGDMVDTSQKPWVELNAPIQEVIKSLSYGRHGITVVMDGTEIVGVITDGDLRRMLEKQTNLEGVTAKDLASFHPKIVSTDMNAREALQKMNENKILQLVVVDEENRYAGIIDFHGLTKEGIRAE